MKENLLGNFEKAIATIEATKPELRLFIVGTLAGATLWNSLTETEPQKRMFSGLARTPHGFKCGHLYLIVSKYFTDPSTILEVIHKKTKEDFIRMEDGGNVLPLRPFNYE